MISYRMGCLGFGLCFSLNTVSTQNMSSFLLEVIFHYLFSPPVLALQAFLLRAPVILGSWRVAGEVGEGVVITAGSFAIFSPIQDTARHLQWAVSCSVMCLPGGKATVKWGGLSLISGDELQRAHGSCWI